jgi:serine/threonine protein kinase
VRPYRIVQELGHGSFGSVYKALDEVGRLVALKVPGSGLAADARERQRFLREVQAQASLKHDHVVAIHYVHIPTGDERPFFVMEYIAGGSLSNRLKQEKILAPPEATRIVREVALGLAAAHARQLVHRDVKPSNSLLDDSSGRAKVGDLGLARQVEPTGELLTESEHQAGTPAYMSRE